MVQATVSQESAIQDFKTQLRGELIGRGDPGHNAARRVHNGMIDRHPRLITRYAT
jgi:hypothetical protein